jgi:oligopeptide/dipeptide ABC transporter ATP-binding protein
MKSATRCSGRSVSAVPDAHPDSAVTTDIILSVDEVSVQYSESARAVDGVSFDVARGEFFGIVGESGCGKSTLLFAIAQLLSPPALLVGGAVTFKGHDMVGLTGEALRTVRWRDYSVVMQSAMNALNPVMTIAAQYDDAMRAHGIGGTAQIRTRSREVLALVGIDAVHLKSYPHQLSGGMRQRVMIAMALLLSPDLVVMDEPTSALDVVAQRSLMVQVKELQRRLGFAVIFVTHDMSLVGHFSDRLAVMYAGRIVEIGPTRPMFANPQHPYTRGLLDSFPSVYGPKVHLSGIPGAPPDLADLPSGCRFRPRCPDVMPRCAEVEPALYPAAEARVRCLVYETLDG